MPAWQRFRETAAVLALFFGFYLVGVALFVGLLVAPIALRDAGHRSSAEAMLAFGWLSALVVLWWLVPRRDRLDLPTPQLTRADQPRFFALLDDVARRCGQPVPDRVHLMGDANAFVARVGGWMGFFARPVMGVGLPLLQGLSTSEFASVLAHEFGHFQRGDTRLMTWIHQARGAMRRMAAGLGDSKLNLPLRWYAIFFLRVTQAAARRQELAADRLAAEVSGASVTRSALQRSRALAMALEHFWRSEYEGVLARGWRAPLAAGFATYLSQSDVRDAMERYVAELLDHETLHPLDAHPSLRNRLLALRDTVGGAAGGLAIGDDTPAVQLLDDLDRLETELLAALVAEHPQPPALRPIAWEDTPEQVLVPAWREQTAPLAAAGLLRGARIADVPALMARAPEIARIVIGAPAERLQPMVVRRSASSALTATIDAALVGAGWRVDTAPGLPVRFRRGEELLETLDLLRRLDDNEIDAREWAGACARLGIAEVSLDPEQYPHGVGVAAAGTEDEAVIRGVARDSVDGAPGASHAGDEGAPNAKDVEHLASLFADRPLGRLAARAQRIAPVASVLLAAVLALTALGWIRTAAGTVDLVTAVSVHQVPIWTAFLPLCGLVALVLVLGRVAGAYGTMMQLALPMMFAGIANLIHTVDSERAYDAGWGMALAAALGFTFWLPLSAGAMFETVPIDARLARLALLGRYGHVRALHALARARGWTMHPPGRLQSYDCHGETGGRAVAIHTERNISGLSLAVILSVRRPLWDFVGSARESWPAARGEPHHQFAVPVGRVGRMPFSLRLVPGVAFDLDACQRLEAVIREGAPLIGQSNGLVNRRLYWTREAQLRQSEGTAFFDALLAWLTRVADEAEGRPASTGS